LSLFIIALGSSCDYKEYADADLPEQSIYMTSAAAATRAPSPTGFYDINTVAVPGELFRYVVNPATNRFNINLGVGRSGVTLEGDVNINIVLNTDTISKLITSGRLASDVLLLPASSFNIQPTAVLVSGTSSVSFPLSIDLAFLLNNPNKRFAIGVGIATNDRKVTRNLNTTIILINTAFLLPVSNFTFAPLAATPRRINFTNTSTNGVTFSWDFGDGSPLSTERTPFRIYDRAGSFNVTLTTIGVTGDAQKSVRTNVVTVN
jgi:PKD repeat protein